MSQRAQSQVFIDDDAVAYGEGLFQYMVAFSAFVAMVVFVTNAFSFRLTARTMDHWCRPPDYLSNLSDIAWKEMAIPHGDKDDRRSCTMFDPPDIADPSAVLVPCSSWHFDLEQYGNSIVSQWSLVCDRKWLVTLALALYATSPIVGLPIVGIAADMYGRKSVTYALVPVLVLASLGSGLTRSFVLFVAMRVIVSVTSTSVLVVMFALLYEVSSGARRLAYLLTSIALAYTSLPVAFFAANSLRPNWIAVYRCLAVLSCVLLVFYYTVDESPRWLLVKWKVHEAERVALRAARLNGIHPRDCLGKLDTGGAELPKVEAGLIAKIFAICEPNLRRRTALLSFIWLIFICAYNVVNLTLIISPNAVVSALNITLAGPAQLLLYPSMRLFGVKRTAVVVSVVFTLLTLVLALQYREQRAVYTTVLLVVLRVLLEMLSLLISIITVATFPTSTRCWGACVLFAVGRVGSFIGLMYSIYEGDHRKDIVLCVMAAFMIFVCGAVEYMPDDADDRSWQGSTARSSISWRNLESTPEKDGRLHGACLSAARTDSSIRSTKEHAMIPLRGRAKRAHAQNDTSSGFSRSQVLSLLEGPCVSSATKMRMHARGSDSSVGRRPSAGHRNSQGFCLTSQHEEQ